MVSVATTLLSVLSVVFAASPTRLMVNGDNDHYFRQRGPEKMTREAMVAYVDDLAQGGKVTDFVMCTMGQRASYDSKVCEPIWLGAGEPGADRWVSNAKLCHERGLDVYRIWIDRCREKGIAPWISMRMNDVHGVTGKDWFRTCGFWRNHPELRRHPELDPLKGGGGWLNFTLDYAHKEVRDYHLAIFKELVDRYDADGYELDWMRWPCCFRPGHEREDAHYLTEFMRECRAYANAAAAKRGHVVRIGVRVPQKLVCAEGFGLDPVRWAKEGLVDLIVPTCFIQAYDYELDFAGWTKAIAAVNPKTEVIPGGANMFSASDYGGTVPFELAAWRGWCDRMFLQGAKGVYLFNADYLDDGVKREVYAKGVDPEQVAKLPRRFLSSFDDITSVEGTLGQRCPFPLAEGKDVVISSGTVPASGRVAVVIATSAKVDAPSVTLNGVTPTGSPVRLTDMAPYCAKYAKDVWSYEFPPDACRSGPNRIAVGPQENSTASVVWCEIAIDSGVSGTIVVDDRIPSGNVKVVSIDQEKGVVNLMPDARADNLWFFTHFRVRGAEGRTVRFLYERNNGVERLTKVGPAVSRDGGKTWRFLNAEKADALPDEFTYAFGPDEKDVRFATSIPYVEANWNAFVGPLKANPRVKLGTLCKSQSGKRENEVLRILPDDPAKAGWTFIFTCRHHACECSASWVVEGLVQEVLADTPEGRWMRENAEVVVVPFVDKDGVEEGDQGKSRKPHDPNQDYLLGHYNSVRAIREIVQEAGRRSRVFFMDNHAPWIRNQEHDHFYSLGAKTGVQEDRWNAWRDEFEKVQAKAALKYERKWDIVWGSPWNSVRDTYLKNNWRMSHAWVMDQPGVYTAFCNEIGYGLCGGVFSEEGAREIGRNMVKAMVRSIVQND